MLKSKASKNLFKIFLTIAIVFGLVFVAFFLIPFESRANWHEITLKPGERYDASNASINTTVIINKAGNYYLKGKSNYVCVSIECDGANVYLEDGLDLNCNIGTCVGLRTAAITIGEQGGTVRLISRKNASIYLEGYMCPAIRKPDNKTALVFETEDPSHPGTITAHGGVQCAGIGTVQYIMGAFCDAWCGNISFNSGIIKATGGNGYGYEGGGAGIGGGMSADASKIYINGGEVYATGGEQAAGIGGGAKAPGYNIYINGGKVVAKSSYGGAGIGGGYSSSPDRGDTSYTWGQGFGEKIVISGGDVYAYSSGHGAAIGGGHNGSAGVEIKGGNVHAEAGPDESVAIGAPAGHTKAEISITGGNVYAKGCPQVPAIGTNGVHATSEVKISGGTITTVTSNEPYMDIGGWKSEFEAGRVNVTITGGSIITGEDRLPCAKDGDGNKTHRVVVGFEGISDSRTRVPDLVFSDSTNYGMNDVYTKDGKVYTWISGDANKRITGAHIKDNVYTGSIASSAKEGTLYLGTSITLNPSPPDQGSKDGRAYGKRGETRLDIIEEPEMASGYRLLRYSIGPSASDVQLADTNGNLSANVEGYTDGTGKWINTSATANVYAVGEPIDYKIRFDSNKPKNASTNVSGNMDDTSCKYGAEYNLSANEYSLPGYDFVGWNTKSDGSGKAYGPGASVSNLTTKDNDIVILYAQWKAKNYSVTLESNVSGIPSSILTCEFDKENTIPTISEMGWVNDGYAFQGWTKTGVVGVRLKDGAKIYNECSLDGSGNPVGRTLNAKWVANGSIVINTVENNEPVDILSSGCKFVVTTTIGAHYDLDVTYDNGTYTVNNVGSIGTGLFYLSIDGNTEYTIPQALQEFTYNGTDAVSIVLDYYTITMNIDNHVSSAYVAKTGGMIQPHILEHMPAGSSLLIDAHTNAGYHFDGYSLCGVEPEGFVGYDGSKVSQSNLIVNRKANITAHADANCYSIVFDKNGGNYISGEMSKQDMVYDQGQKLFKNKYNCDNGKFTGWNTMKNGSGISYTDEQDVLNMTANNATTITLYAQWDMEEYPIEYDLDGGNYLPGVSNPARYTVADTFTLNNPVKEDYNFAGWVGTDCNTPTNEVTIPQGSTGARKYYAQWTMKSYLVRFELNGGVGEREEVVPIHKKAYKPEDPISEHYTFGGWYTDKELTQLYDFDQEVTGDMTLYAKWYPIKHYITFDLDGGILNGQMGQIVIEANEGDTIIVPDAPIKEGYTFKYWRGSEYYPGDKYVVKEDHTLTAVWQKGSPSIVDIVSDGIIRILNGIHTGDNAPIVLAIALILLGGVVIVTVLLIRSRKKHKK